jgi:HemY protein
VHLATVLEKRDALPAEAVESIVTGARVAQLGRVSHDLASLDEYWRGVPAAERVRPKIAGEAAAAFARLGDRARARQVVEDALGAGWDSELALAYSDATGADALSRIQRAEQWLCDHPRDPLLLLALGRLCLQAELWGKAESFLQASLAARPSREAHLAMASLFSRIGRAQEADRHFRASADPVLAAPTAASETPRELRRA